MQFWPREARIKPRPPGLPRTAAAPRAPAERLRTTPSSSAPLDLLRAAGTPWLQGPERLQCFFRRTERFVRIPWGKPI